MKDFDYSRARKVEIQDGEKMYSANYFVEKGILTITSEFGYKSAHLGGLTAEGLARMLLRELITKK